MKALFDVAIAGDDEPAAVVERAALTRVREEPDLARKLRLCAEFVADTAPRHVPPAQVASHLGRSLIDALLPSGARVTPPVREPAADPAQH